MSYTKESKKRNVTTIEIRNALTPYFLKKDIFSENIFTEENLSISIQNRYEYGNYLLKNEENPFYVKLITSWDKNGSFFILENYLNESTKINYFLLCSNYFNKAMMIPKAAISEYISKKNISCDYCNADKEQNRGKGYNIFSDLYKGKYVEDDISEYLNKRR